MVGEEEAKVGTGIDIFPSDKNVKLCLYYFRTEKGDSRRR